MPGGIFDQAWAQFDHAEQLASKRIQTYLQGLPSDVPASSVAQTVADIVQQQYLQRLDTKEFFQLIYKQIDTVYKALLKGDKQLPRTNTTVSDLRAMEFLAKSDLTFLEKFAKSSQLRERITEWITENYDPNGSVPQLLTGLRAELALAKFKVDQILNTTVSHARVFGQLNGFRASGAKTFQIVGPDDSKTCAYCLEMLGRTFDVAVELTHFDKFINNDPTASSDVHPFLKGNLGLKALEDMDDSEVQDQGFATPPYHPSCRHSLAVVAFYANLDEVPYPVG